MQLKKLQERVKRSAKNVELLEKCVARMVGTKCDVILASKTLRSKSLLDFFRDSPHPDVELFTERNQDYPRDFQL